MLRNALKIASAVGIVLATAVGLIQAYHGVAHQDIVTEAIRAVSIPFTVADENDITMGVLHEDDGLYLVPPNPRYRHHHYNAVTGEGNERTVA